MNIPSLAVARCLPYLWSKGISQYCDFAGPETYWLQGTESQQAARFFRQHYANAHGVVWLRLGTKSRDGEFCDLDRFVEEALPTIRQPFALITTDGDASVPCDLATRTVDALTRSPWLVSWHTQNYDGTGCSKIAPIPIGLDLHTTRDGMCPERLVELIETIRANRPAVHQVPLRGFCDLGVSLASQERIRAVAALGRCRHVDFLTSRISQAEIWRRYAQYPFVISAEGNGLDCHRTWELLYLGCIVITRSSSLDPLFEDLPVVVVEDWDEVCDRKNLAAWLRHYAQLTERRYIRHRLHPANYLRRIREGLATAKLKIGATEPKEKTARAQEL